MQNSLSHSVPSNNNTSFVRALLVIFFFTASLSTMMAQSSTPLRALNPVMMLEIEESESVTIEHDYANEPSSPVTKEEIRTFLVEGNLPDSTRGTSGPDSYVAESSETTDPGEADISFAIEPAATPFEIGKEADFEGLRIANIDPDGRVILMEDMIEPILYLRFQKIMTGYVNVKIYDENGSLMMADKASNLMIGTELQLDYRDWPEGMHSLLVYLDNGTKWTKKIVKTGPFVSNY